MSGSFRIVIRPVLYWDWLVLCTSSTLHDIPPPLYFLPEPNLVFTMPSCTEKRSTRWLSTEQYSSERMAWLAWSPWISGVLELWILAWTSDCFFAAANCSLVVLLIGTVSFGQSTRFMEAYLDPPSFSRFFLSGKEFGFISLTKKKKTIIEIP